MKLLIIFVANLALISSNPLSVDNEKDEAITACSAHSLVNEGFLDKSFPYKTVNDGFACSFLTSVLKNEIVSEVNISRYSDENKNCAKKYLSLLNYPAMYLKIVIYETSDEITESQKTESIKNTASTLVQINVLISEICQPDLELNDFFDIYRQNTKNYMREKVINEKQFYCLRKYAVDKELVNATVYNVNFNPSNIVIDFECDGYVEQFFNFRHQIVEGNWRSILSKSQLQHLPCILNKTLTQNMNEFFLKMVVLMDVLNDDQIDQIEEFRGEFLETRSASAKETVKCLK